MQRITTLLVLGLWVGTACQVCVADSPAVVRAVGTVEPANLVEISSPVAGAIQKFGADPRDASKTIDYGTTVKQGQVLLQLDPTLASLAYDKAKADVDQARAHLVIAKAHVAKALAAVDRQAKLQQTSAAPAADVDAARLELDVARANMDAEAAEVAKREADLKLAKINLANCTIVSPIDGFVLDRRINAHAPVPANQVLFLICDDSKKFQVWASVSEADIARIAKGQTAHFSVEALPKQKFTGKVVQVRSNALLNAGAVTYTVVIDVENGDHLLPYLTANVEIETEAAK